MPGLRPLTALGAVGLLAGALILGGCAAGQNSGDKAVDAAAEASKSAENKKPEASVKDGQKDVNPAKPITVKIGDGELSTVTMTNEDGKVVEASLDKDKKKWETTEPLGYSRTYTLTIEAKGEKKQEMSFSTIDATNTTTAARIHGWCRSNNRDQIRHQHRKPSSCARRHHRQNRTQS